MYLRQIASRKDDLKHPTTSNQLLGTARRLLLLAITAAVLAALPATAQAAPYLVDTNSDSAALDSCLGADNDCSLRGAISLANQDAAADTLTFEAGMTIQIGTPLPDVLENLTIDANFDVFVTGSGTYDCDASDYAIDIRDAGATPSFIFGVVFNDVCGRAIASNQPPPSIAVGPRRADNTVPITGSSGNASSVEIFRADPPAADGEASAFFQPAGVAGGAYYYLPAPTPPAGDQFTALASGPSGTSGYAARATTPSDLVSPQVTNAVAVSNNTVRVDFSEQIASGSVSPAGFSVGMAGAARAITAASAYGNSVYLTSNQPWNTGEAGNFGLTGAVRVTDLTGNEVLGGPSGTVFAGPGEITTPVISAYRASPSRFCQKKTRSCKRGNTYLLVTLNKDARVIFNVYKGVRKTRELVRFIRRLKAGRNRVKFTASVNGKALPASVLSVRATAQDVARSLSPPVDAIVRIVKNKRDL